VTDEWTVWSTGRMKTQENQNNQAKMCPTATCPPKNPTHTGLGLNPGLHHDRPVSNCLNQSTNPSNILIRSTKMQQVQVFITANLLYMFRASINPIIRSTSNCNTASGTCHTVSTKVLN